MKDLRMMGNIVKKISEEKNIKIEDLANEIECSLENMYSFLNGRMFLAFDQIESISKILDVNIDKILNGDIDYYEETVVHCMGDFENSDNREEILDIIDNYMNLISN